LSARRFEGKNVIVTGAGQGIGRAIVERFAAEGAEVLLIGRRRDPLEKAVQEIDAGGGRAFAHAADVGDSEEVREAVAAAMARWGRIDVRVNNAGLAEEAPFLEVAVASWDRVLGTNLRGAFLIAQAVARDQVSTGGGSIVHIASIDASEGTGRTPATTRRRLVSSASTGPWRSSSPRTASV
jgi:NAD(P)-dependent dehydrogenase (short-subunit alcohol dehydrogenase family)